MRALSGAPSTDREAVVALAGSAIGGDVNVHLFTESTRRAVERWRVRRKPRALDERYEDQVAGWFVEPDGWDRATLILRQRRMVLLTAASGSGRRTAAIRLLGTDDCGSGPIQELPVHPDPDADVLDRDAVMDNARLLLDFSAATDLFERIHGELAGFWSTVRERHAALVVVLPDRVERDLYPELADLLVRLGRPVGASVFQRHLAACRIEPPRDELRRHELAQV